MTDVKGAEDPSPRPGSPASSSSSSSSSDDQPDPAITAVREILARENTEFNWMPAPSGSGSSSGCPPGLEYLTQLTHLLVHQQIDLTEALTHQETENTYRIKNAQDQDVYFAAEKSTELSRQYSGSGRELSISILDSSQKEVIHLERPASSSLGYCCGYCCSEEIEVQAPPGSVAGRVRQEPSGIFHPWFSVLDSEEQMVLQIKGPFLGCGGADAEFEVLSGDDGEGVGRIRKLWGGQAKEQYTDADSFEIQFPKDLSVKMKAVMLGAMFLIDLMFFERAASANAPSQDQDKTSEESA